MKNTFPVSIIPTNDDERLKALYRYEILDTPPEGAFNKVAELAVKMFDVPVSLISLVDKERVFYKASTGVTELNNVERGISVCSLAVLDNAPVVFENAEKDPCLLANPFVTSEFGLRFYAGAPLITHDGYNIGTICIIDKKPRVLSDREKSMLVDLASIVMDEIEIRLSSIKAIREQADLLHFAAHDLKNPIHNIKALAELFAKEDGIKEKEKLAGLLQQSSGRVVNLIERIVKSSEIENERFELNLESVNLEHLLKDIVLNNQSAAIVKEITINYNVEIQAFATVDPHWMADIFDNLVSNAIKYSMKGKSIFLSLLVDENVILFQVKDEGQGFSKEDLDKVFRKFSRLSSRPTAGEPSSGLGLSIVKTLVDMHNGEVEIKSDGKYKGSEVTVKIPNRKL